MILKRIANNSDRTETGLTALSLYGKYAIGEILLIVIGVLVAIQINNWNEDRIRRAAQLLIIQNLREAVRDDRGSIAGVIGNYSRTIAVVNQMEKQSQGVANYPDAASKWIELVFARNTTGTVYSNYSNNSIEIDDPELSVTLSNYISR